VPGAFTKFNWRKVRRWLAMGTVLLLLIFLGGSWMVGGALVAPVLHDVGPAPAEMPVETITIPSESGSSLAAWFIPAENASATIVLLHPIRGDRRSMLGRAKLLHDAGYSALLVDLQGHGESPGDQITAGYLERLDVIAAVEYARARNPRHKIGVVGRSLGGAAALLASPLEIDALVIESVYPTLSEAVHNRVAMRVGPLHHLLAPVLLAQLNPRLGISTSQLRPIDNIAAAGCPVLVAAGDLDEHTTLRESERLYAAAKEPKQLSVFAGAAHVDLLQQNPEQYRNEVVKFLNVNLKSKERQESP